MVILPGEIYEDCAFHPVLCVEYDAEDRSVSGISLIDGSSPRNCSLDHCGVVKLTIEQAWRWKVHGPDEIPDDIDFPADRRWWTREFVASS